MICLTKCRVVILLILFSCKLAGGQERFPDAPRLGWDLAIWLTGASGEENRNSFVESQIFSAGVFVGRSLTRELGSGWRRGNLVYGFNLIPSFIQFTPHRLYGVGFEPVVLHWNSGVHLKQAFPYLEIAGGAVRSNSNFPAGDTSHFNFTARGGGGLQLFSGQHHFVQLGCQWWHISNANLGVRNPEFNGIQLSVGYHWLK